MDFLTTLLSFATNHLDMVVGFGIGVVAGHAVPWLYTSVMGLFSSSTASVIETDISTAVNTIKSTVGDSSSTTTTPAPTAVPVAPTSQRK